MKKMKHILFASLLGFLFGTTQAQALDLYGFGSYWDRGDLGDTWGGGAGINFPLIIDLIRLDGRVYFFDSSKVGTENVNITPVDLGLQIHLFPGGSFDPYVLGGVSYNFVDSGSLDLDSKFGGYLGGGLELGLGSSHLFSVFAEALYRYTDISGDFDWNDVDASGFTANIGLKFHFL
ncbi:MAG: outer membrane beta-barrel protein [Desulfobulbales bacterium]